MYVCVIYSKSVSSIMEYYISGLNLISITDLDDPLKVTQIVMWVSPRSQPVTYIKVETCHIWAQLIASVLWQGLFVNVNVNL